MTDSDAVSGPFWKPLPAKTRLYESLYSMNRGFEITLLSLERLEQLGMFRLEFLNSFKVSLEYIRAQANEELIETLQEFEQEQSAHFDRMQHNFEQQFKDPDDVFFAADGRKKEIKEQMKELQKGLDRQKVKRRSKRR